MKKSSIHFNYTVADGHNDTMMKIIDEETWLPVADMGQHTDNHIDIPKMIEGGLNVAFFASFTPGYYGNVPRSLSRNLALINALYFTANNNPDTFQITNTVDEIENAVKDNKIAAVPTIEGAYAIDEFNYKELLKQFYDLGIRVIAPTWNYSNAIGEGCNRVYGDDDKTPSEGGLTKLGEKVIEEMNKLGILIDVSHLAEETFWDVIKVSKSPLIASHSGVYNLRNHQRNLKDDQLLAIKENSGVVSVVLFPNFLSDKDEVYIKDFVDHIDYIVNLIGIDHVGIGSDFDGAEMPLDLKDASEMYKITEELIVRGYIEEDIEKILGKNILRVLNEAQKIGEYDKKALKGNIQYNDGMITLKFDNNMDIDVNKCQMVIDGVLFESGINADSSKIIHKLKEGLTEKFHVITFQIFNTDKEIEERYTNIIHIN
ncbi:MAG: dipeptidase [Tissierellaceae bacterium]|nr:dipeptidase [Tissierellaceae bacterium]